MKLKQNYNPVFQVHGNAKAELKSQKETIESQMNLVRVAQNKRLVREGGYDPVTLLDRRSGQQVGPLPISLEKKKNVNEHGTNARSGANVAYALGCDRYGNPESRINAKRGGDNTAQVDHVTELMKNEGMVADGHHDLEMRIIVPSRTQMLLDDRYADQYDARLFEITGIDNKQVLASVNSAHNMDKKQKAVRQASSHYEPVLGVHDILGSDHMSTWAPINTLRDNAVNTSPSTNREHPNPFTSAWARENREREEIEAERGGMEDDPYYREIVGKVYEQPVRLWPEELKELSRRAGDLEKAKKGI